MEPRTVLTEPEPVFELAEEANPAPAVEAPAALPIESPSSPEPPAGERSSSPATVEQAIEEVSGIIDSLRGALDDMEEVLEMLEVFERQKNLDEREIESLQRALRQAHRPRDGGHHSHR